MKGNFDAGRVFWEYIEPMKGGTENYADSESRHLKHSRYSRHFLRAINDNQ
jgi:hypothetical protein